MKYMSSLISTPLILTWILVLNYNFNGNLALSNSQSNSQLEDLLLIKYCESIVVLDTENNNIPISRYL